MSVVSVPDVIDQLSELISSGDIPAARKLGRKLIHTADIKQLWLIGKIADLLENRPNTGVDILRHWWKLAPTETDRAIIEACAPKNGEQRHRARQSTGRAPQWSRSNSYRAPSTVSTSQRDDMRRRRLTRQQQRDAEAFSKYQADRAGIAEGDQIQDRDQRTRANQVYASGFDYDRAALFGTRGTRCVSCWISRGPGELNAERINAGHGDDGLCVECRESGQLGITELPVGHTFTDAVNARCWFIVFATECPRVALRTEWKQASSPALRAAIADFVTTKLPDEHANQTDAAEPATCASCSEQRTARDVRGLTTDDGLCAECRAVDAEHADAEQAQAAA